jgi:hypothetical protein
METGRKFWITIFAMIGAMLVPEVAPHLTALAISFCGGNAAISIAYARNDANSRSVSERRDYEAGIDPAP